MILGKQWEGGERKEEGEIPEPKVLWKIKNFFWKRNETKKTSKKYKQLLPKQNPPIHNSQWVMSSSNLLERDKGTVLQIDGNLHSQKLNIRIIFVFNSVPGRKHPSAKKLHILIN